tara:strand:+ start:159 stop:815 length:657 start_codon:yes stop_codon:yes gene_type:complete
MIEIVPAFLVKSQEEFEQKLRLVEDQVNLIQVDVLDGTLFPNTCWYDPKRVGSMKTSIEIELHLMVENPIPIVEAWKNHVPTFKRAIVHAEMHRPTGTITGFIKDELGLEVGVAINPETPLKEIEDVIHHIDVLTVMGVHPGESGRAFEGEYILEKIAHARKHRPDLVIEIDGGVTDELIEPLVKAGVNRVCVASLIFKNDNPSDKLKELIDRLGDTN